MIWCRASTKIMPWMATISDSDGLADRIRACRACAGVLPFEPKPIVQIGPWARLLIASQAPGRLAHASGIPFDDPSGDRLRTWLGIDRPTFYDQSLVAILPTAFCYPGTSDGHDLPPLEVCAGRWHRAV